MSGAALAALNVEITPEFGSDTIKLPIVGGADNARVAFNGESALVQYSGSRVVMVGPSSETTFFRGAAPIGAVASNGDTFLTAGRFGSSGQIGAVRVSAAGELLDILPIVMGAPVAAALSIAASSSGSDYFVAWAESVDSQLHRARINAHGALELLPSITAPGPASFLTLASNGAGYLLVWQGSSASGDGFIYGMRFSGEGATLDASPFQIAPAFGDQISAASAGGNYLVGSAGSFAFQSQAFIVPAAGPVSGLLPVFSSTEFDQIAVGAVGSRYFVAGGQLGLPSFVLPYSKVSVLNADGTPALAEPVLLCDDCNTVAIGSGSSQAFVAWTGRRFRTHDIEIPDPAPDIFGQVFDQNVVPVSQLSVISLEPPREELTSLVGRGSEFWAAGNAYAEWASATLRTIQPDGTISGGGGSSPTGAIIECHNFNPMLTSGDLHITEFESIDQREHRTLSGWQQGGGLGQGANCVGELFTTVLAAADLSNDSSTFVALSSGSEVFAQVAMFSVSLPFVPSATFKPTVAATVDAGTYVVTGIVGAPNAGRVGVVRVSEMAELLDSSPILVDGAAGAKGRVAIAFNGSSHLVVWEDYSTDVAGDLYGARVDRAGVLLDSTPIPIAVASGSQTLPRVAADGQDFFVVWSHERGSSNPDVHGRRIAASGAPIDAEPLLISADGVPEYGPHVASIELGRWLVGYTRQDPLDINSGRVRFRFVGDASPSPNGASCSDASECSSGFCVDGVCCNSGCAGGTSDCQACNVPGSLGTCATRPGGSSCDDGVSCTTNDQCNGTTCAGSSASCPLAAPTLIAPSGPGIGRTPTFRFDSIPQATRYFLWVDDATGNRIKTVFPAEALDCAGGGVCTATPSTVLSTGNARFWVQAQNPSKTSLWSAVMMFKVASGLPAVPTLTGPTGTQTTATPTYRFNGVADAAEYDLWVNDSGGVRVQKLVTATEAGCAASSACAVMPTIALRTGTVTWWVRAKNAYGFSGWSTPLTFNVTLPPLAPPILISPSGTIQALMPGYAWQPSAGATSYYLWVNDATGTKIQSVLDAAIACGVSSCNVTPGTSLALGAGKWWVQASDASRTSAWSAAMSFRVVP